MILRWIQRAQHTVSGPESIGVQRQALGPEMQFRFSQRVSAHPIVFVGAAYVDDIAEFHRAMAHRQQPRLRAGRNITAIEKSI